MRNRRIPERWPRWIEAFCYNRSASVVLYGGESALETLPFLGVPQGSPRSPMIYLSFNADLVERDITERGDSVDSVDNYTVWVTGDHARKNQLNLSRIVDEAVIWERRSGATFEEGKTTYIHFTRNSRLLDTEPINIKGITKTPQQEVNILRICVVSLLRLLLIHSLNLLDFIYSSIGLGRLSFLEPSLGVINNCLPVMRPALQKYFGSYS